MNADDITDGGITLSAGQVKALAALFAEASLRGGDATLNFYLGYDGVAPFVILSQDPDKFAPLNGGHDSVDVEDIQLDG